MGGGQITFFSKCTGLGTLFQYVDYMVFFITAAPFPALQGTHLLQLTPDVVCISKYTVTIHLVSLASAVVNEIAIFHLSSPRPKNDIGRQQLYLIKTSPAQATRVRVLRKVDDLRARPSFFFFFFFVFYCSNSLL